MKPVRDLALLLFVASGLLGCGHEDDPTGTQPETEAQANNQPITIYHGLNDTSAQRTLLEPSLSRSRSS